MEISYYLFLAIYGLGILFFVIYSLVNIFHIFRFGFLDGNSVFMIVFYLGISLVIFVISYEFLKVIPWTETLEITMPSIDLPALNL